MQIGQSVWLRHVFYENGSLATGGRAYLDNLGHDDQVRLRSALKARREVFQQQRGAVQATEPTLSVAQLYENAYSEIEPVLDRFALNDKIKDLASEAPSVRIYLSSSPNATAWLRSLSEDRQTRVRDAIADRNAIQNIGPRIIAASAILADPANDLSVAAAGIDRSTQDLQRLFNDSGLTERGMQYLSRLTLERAATVQYNFQLRNSRRRRAAMLSREFSLSIPATPASGADVNLNLDAWHRQLTGASVQESPVPTYTPESSFAMPPTPSGGWQCDITADADAGPSNVHDDAASAPPPYSRESSLSIPSTPASGADVNLNLDAWHRQMTEASGQESPVPTYTSESSFAMPSTPSGGWQWDINMDADAGPSNLHDDAASAAPAHSREFSRSIPSTPASGADANLNLDAWHGQMTEASGQESPVPTYTSESSFAMPSTPSGGWQWDINMDADAGPSNLHDDAASAAPAHSREFSRSIPSTPASGADANLNLDAWHGQMTEASGQESPVPTYTPESSFAMPPTPSGGRQSDINADADAGPSNLHDDAASAAPAYSREFSLSIPSTPSSSSNLDSNLDAWRASLMGDSAQESPAPIYAPQRSDSHAAIASTEAAASTQDPILALLPSIAAGVAISEMQVGQSVSLRSLFDERGRLSAAGNEYCNSLGHADQLRFLEALSVRRTSSQRYSTAFTQISAILDRFALNESYKALKKKAPALRRLLTATGLDPVRGEGWLHTLSADQRTRVLDAIADRNAIRFVGRQIVEASDVLADPANDLPSAAFRIRCSVHHLERLLNPSGLTGRGMQHVARLSPQDQARVLHNIQLRQSRAGGTPSRPLDTAAGEGSSRAPRDPLAERRSILDAQGRALLNELQQRVRGPLGEYFVRGDGITEKGFQLFKTLSEQEQTLLQLVLSIPRDVMTFYEVSALLDQYESGVAGVRLREQMPNFSSYLTEGGGLGGSGGTVWFRFLSPDRQARIARAIENRQIITAIGPRFANVTSTFSNPANDMDRVAERADVTTEQLARFLTEDGLTPMGQRFLETCDNRTRHAIEANIALRRG